MGLTGKTKITMGIHEIPGKGRGVLVEEFVPAGSYLCEYKTTEVYPRANRAKKEQEYATNGEPCMILEVQTPQGWFCLDATRKYNTLGRLLNHAAPHVATAKPFKPLLVNGKWRVGFLSTKDLQPGTEVTWDYACPPQGQQWLMKRSKVREFPLGLQA